MVVTQRLTQADLPDGRDAGARARGHAARRDLPVPAHERPARPLPAALRDAVERHARAAPGRRASPTCVPFGGYLKEVHVEVDPDAPPRSGLTLARRRATRSSESNLNVGGGFLRHGDQELTMRGIGYRRLGRGPQETSCSRASDGTAGHRRRRRERVQLAATPRRGAVGLERQARDRRGLRADAPRREPVARARRRARSKVDELNDTILPKGMKIEPFYDRTRPRRATRSSTVHDNLLHRRSCSWSRVVWLFLRSVRRLDASSRS